MSAARFVTHLRYLFVRASRASANRTEDVDKVSQPSLLAALRAECTARLRVCTEGFVGAADAVEAEPDS